MNDQFFHRIQENVCQATRPLFLVGLVLSIALSQADVQAQSQPWVQNGNDISNTNSGNVGIGTTSPVAKMEVVSSDGIDALRVTNVPNAYEIHLTGTAGNSSIFSDNNFTLSAGTGQPVMIQANSADLTLSTNASGHIVLSPSGNVGIGTVTPTAKLEIARTDTSTTTFPESFFVNQTIDPSGSINGSSSVTATGAHIGLAIPSSNNQDLSKLFWNGLSIFNTSSIDGTGNVNGLRGTLVNIGPVRNGTFTLINGGTFRAQKNNIGSATTVEGLRAHGGISSAVGATSAIDAVGVRGIVQSAAANSQTATIQNAYGVLSEIYTHAAESLITNSYGVYIANGKSPLPHGAFPDQLGHVTNQYQLYIENPNKGDTILYSIYSAGGINHFAGNVGIGTTTPTEKLDVAGNAKITGNATITGDLNVAGNLAAKYQDVAEWVKSSKTMLPGTVAILDPALDNQVLPSDKAYDTRVAGVISTQPGIALGEKGVEKVLVAAAGRVKVKATASNGPIAIGDLLVTSSQNGTAMRSTTVDIGGISIHRPGTVLGKALQSLKDGDGEILVLLTLQ